ncbi:hypothetical protein [Polaribacter sargassicola]|uniref:hypothetical protein n=1 Tax=Polaribacter sargassicola TaxID=2836891 RepID=UPI001F1C33EB|nr:hypothetical protein [Polaribacter sp. DS7-9]MCG1037264.1 hypothetical protein [Polaribacter sp. DS7-9]
MKKILLLLVITFSISATVNAQTSSSLVKDSKVELLKQEVSLKSLLEVSEDEKEEVTKEEENKRSLVIDTVAYNVYKKLLSRRSKLMYC